MAFLGLKKDEGTNPQLTQCEWQLGQIEKGRLECFTDIGRLFAQKTTVKEAEGTPYEELVSKLAALEERRELLEKRKLALQNLRKCEKCGAILTLDSAFCNKCGEKLEPIEPEVLTDAPLCPSCKAPIEEGSTFCTRCGASISAEAKAKPKNDAAGKVCPSCGAVCDASDLFCVNCGGKMS